MSPSEVDALRFTDFILLITHIDAYCPDRGGCTIHKAKEGSNQWPFAV